MVVGEPAQEILALAELVRRQRRRPLLHFGNDRVQALAHGSPVVDRRPHVVEHPGDILRQCIQANRLRHAIDLDVDEGFAPRILGAAAGERSQRSVGAARDLDDRVDDEVQRQSVTVDLHRHRIDEKGHVVVDDFDDRMRRLPAMLLERRIEDPDPGATRLAFAREIPVRQCGAVEVGRFPLGKILRVDVPVVARGEILHHGTLRGCHLGADELNDLVQSSRAAIVCVCVHGVLFVAYGPHGAAAAGIERGRGPARVRLGACLSGASRSTAPPRAGAAPRAPGLWRRVNRRCSIVTRCPRRVQRDRSARKYRDGPAPPRGAAQSRKLPRRVHVRSEESAPGRLQSCRDRGR